MLRLLNNFSKKQKLIVYIIFIALITFIVYWVVITISRNGETKVTIRVVPEDSKLTINDSEVIEKTQYLSPGKYKFAAEKEGFETYTQEVEVTSESRTINLLPEPISEEAKKWISENRDVQIERESLGEENSQHRAKVIETNNPLISNLPHYDLTGPFSIDYGLAKGDESRILLIVSDSTAKGRKSAIEWIKSQGEDPTDYEIVFSDFLNPLDDHRSRH